ncbi:MAG: arsenite transporter [Mycobacterium sp.]|nr:arsenite transporter [Mycobacterium sp.]
MILFALQGDQITTRPWDVARIALPLLAYFAIMWGGGYLLGSLLGLGYERTTTLAFTAAGNNFELAIAVAIATYGATSGQALAGVVGPLIEVPVLVALVYVSLALRRRFTHHTPNTSPPTRRRERISAMTDSPVTHQLRHDLSQLRHDLSIDQRHALRTAATRLESEYADTFSAETVERFLHTSYDQFAGRATIPNFLPLLAERFARQRLHALARVEGKISDRKPAVLFLCTHNSCAPTTPAAHRWRWASSPISPASRRSPGRADPNPAARSTRSPSPPWPRSVSTSPVNIPNPGPTKSCKPPTWSSRWAAGTPAPSSPESATRTGNSQTPPAKTSAPCGPSATTSRNASTGCWPT